MHKVAKEEDRGNVFQQGISGWKMLFGVFKKKKEEPQQNQQQNNGQNQQQTQNQ